MIPASLDYISMFDDLNRQGTNDYKIEAMCGFSEGALAHYRKNPERKMIYDNGARLYNLWCEMDLCPTDWNQAVVATT